MRKVIYAILIIALLAVSTCYTLYSRGAFPEKDTAVVTVPPESVSSFTEEEKADISDIELEKTELPIATSAGSADLVLTNIAQKYNAAGVSVVAFQQDEILYRFNYGYRDLNKKIACDSNTKYRVASLSKTFSAITAVHMVDAGLLDLDKDIADYLGYRVRNPQYTGTPITMRMLLTHTSSIYDCPLYNESIGGTFHSNQSILSSGSAFTGAKPGGQYRYTNFGLALAGAVMEAASGEYFSDYARQRVFLPMGIDASYIPKELSDTENIANCYSSGHGLARSREALLQQRRRFGEGQLQGHAQGSLTISAEDYARGLMTVLCGGALNGKRILSEQSAQEMTTIQFEKDKVREALCMREWTSFAQGRRLLCHSGDSFGILCAFAVDPEEKIGVVVITNGANQHVDKETGYYQICTEILKSMYSYL